jgi:hypothetical protein
LLRDYRQGMSPSDASRDVHATQSVQPHELARAHLVQMMS